MLSSCMLTSKKELFTLPDSVHYLNCAYMSPLPKFAEEAGIKGLLRKRNPTAIAPEDFFTDVEVLKSNFAKLINARPDQIAIIPSVSYGLANAANNVNYLGKQHAITLGGEFPSDYFALHKACKNNGIEIKKIEAESDIVKGREWNTKILEAINPDTSIVNISSVHWMDGTAFDLEKIGQRCSEVDASFVVDGTQSVGMKPIDVQRMKINALICVSYKWLLGPYSFGLAYYDDSFNNGKPIEESWMNRNNARDFSNLSNYNFEYSPGAGRYNVGESSNFIAVPMASASIQKILAWNPSAMTSYCEKISSKFINWLKEKGIEVEEEAYRSKHLFGMRIPDHLSADQLFATFKKCELVLSRRGSFIRVSPNVYNEAKDFDVLIECLEESYA